MSITTHTSTIRQYVKNHTKDDIAFFFEDQFVKKDAEIEMLKGELARLAVESMNRDIALAKLEGEVNALRKLCSDKACNHAWDREWRDERTGRIYRNCVICGVKVEMP